MTITTNLPYTETNVKVCSFLNYLNNCRDNRKEQAQITHNNGFIALAAKYPYRSNFITRNRDKVNVSFARLLQRTYAYYFTTSNKITKENKKTNVISYFKEKDSFEQHKKNYLDFIVTNSICSQYSNLENFNDISLDDVLNIVAILLDKTNTVKKIKSSRKLKARYFNVSYNEINEELNKELSVSRNDLITNHKQKVIEIEQNLISTDVVNYSSCRLYVLRKYKEDKKTKDVFAILENIKQKCENEMAEIIANHNSAVKTKIEELKKTLNEDLKNLSFVI